MTTPSLERQGGGAHSRYIIENHTNRGAAASVMAAACLFSVYLAAALVLANSSPANSTTGIETTAYFTSIDPRVCSKMIPC